jgi:hypothetical protein
LAYQQEDSTLLLGKQQVRVAGCGIDPSSPGPGMPGIVPGLDFFGESIRQSSPIRQFRELFVTDGCENSAVSLIRTKLTLTLALPLLTV